MTRQTEIDQEIKAYKARSTKAYKEAKKATALINKVMEENHFYFTLVLNVGDKRKKT